MTAGQVAALGPAFTDYPRAFRPCFVTRNTFGHLGTYCRGLLSDLPRPQERGADRPARRGGRPHAPGVPGPPRLGSRADAGRAAAPRRPRAPARPRRPARGGRGHGGLDRGETGVPKQGGKTPGVRRQYRGAIGKVGNCVVTVHLACPVRGLHGPARLRPVPARGGLGRGPRPASGGPRPRPGDLRTPASGSWPRGRSSGRRPTASASTGWRSTSGTAASPSSWPPWGSGACCCTSPRRPGTCPAARACRSTGRCSGRPPPSGPTMPPCGASRSRAGPGGGPARPARPWPTQAGRCGRPGSTCPATANPPTGPSGWSWPATAAPGRRSTSSPTPRPRTALPTLMKAASTRAGAGRVPRPAKSEAGPGHFAGRGYKGLMRHMALCQLVLLFAAEQTDRLRGEKPRGDGGAGRRGVERPVPHVARTPLEAAAG